jgi:hypothetical protein
MTIRASHTVFFPSGTANLLHFFGGMEMKNAFVLLIGIALVGPALAEQPPSPPAPSSAEAGNGSVRYAPNAERLADGQYRAEVRRNNGAPGADEIAWSSAPHASAPEAIKEACKMIEMVYVPGTRCPTAAVASKKAIQRPAQAKAATKPATATAVKKVGVISQVSGYEVRGCAFYALVAGKVVQRCPSEGAPGTKPFWYNEDAFEGGYGGSGR